MEKNQPKNMDCLTVKIIIKRSLKNMDRVKIIIKDHPKIWTELKS